MKESKTNKKIKKIVFSCLVAFIYSYQITYLNIPVWLTLSFIFLLAFLLLLWNIEKSAKQEERR